MTLLKIAAALALAAMVIVTVVLIRVRPRDEQCANMPVNYMMSRINEAHAHLSKNYRYSAANGYTVRMSSYDPEYFPGSSLWLLRVNYVHEKMEAVAIAAMIDCGGTVEFAIWK